LSRKTSLVGLLGLLVSGLLSALGSLRVDVVGEGTLEDVGIDLVNDVNVDREENTGRLGVEESMAEEGESGAEVHGIAGDVEGESGDLLSLQDTEVVTEVGTIDTKTVVGRENKGLADGIKGNSNNLGNVLVSLRDRERRLDAQCVVVNNITGDAEGEDDNGKSVDGDVLVSTENLAEDASLVLKTTNNVPKGGVEEDEASGDPERLLAKLDVLGGLSQKISRHGFYKFSSFAVI